MLQISDEELANLLAVAYLENGQHVDAIQVYESLQRINGEKESAVTLFYMTEHDHFPEI